MPTATALASLLVSTMAAGLAPIAEASAAPPRTSPAAAASAPLKGLTVRLGAVRTWVSFDGRTPVVKADERWASGAMRLVSFSDPLLGSGRPASFAGAAAPRAGGRSC